MKITHAIFTLAILSSFSVTSFAGTIMENSEKAIRALDSVNSKNLSTQDKEQIEYAKSKLLLIQRESGQMAQPKKELPTCSIVGGAWNRKVIMEGKGVIFNGGECGQPVKYLESLLVKNECKLVPTGTCGY